MSNYYKNKFFETTEPLPPIINENILNKSNQANAIFVDGRDHLIVVL
jgi:hypothetical protein